MHLLIFIAKCNTLPFRTRCHESMRPPVISRLAVSRLILSHFPFKHVKASSIEEFVSYDDRNYFFRGERLDHEVGSRDSPSSEYVLKVVNSSDTPELVAGLSGVTKYLHEKGYRCPYPIARPGGEDMTVLSKEQLVAFEENSTREDKDPCEMMNVVQSSVSERFCVRVLVFVPGDLLVNVPQSPDLLYKVGNYLGSLDKELQEYSHSAIENRTYEQWDLQVLLNCRRFLPYIHDQQKVQLLEKVFTGFEDHVVPIIPTLRRGIIHNDPNDMNIIVNKSDDVYSVAMIDFGDCMVSAYVFELAMAMAYSMCSKEDPVRFILPLLAGYLNAFSLPDSDLNCLYWAVLGRLAQSCANGEYQYQLEPTNTYLLASAIPAWKLISQILDIGKSQVDHIWAEARAN